MPKFSELILKEKLRLHQSAGIELAEIVVSFNSDETDKFWEESEPWKRAYGNFLKKELSFLLYITIQVLTSFPPPISSTYPSIPLRCTPQKG